jgi:hypothetical protein
MGALFQVQQPLLECRNQTADSWEFKFTSEAKLPVAGNAFTSVSKHVAPGRLILRRASDATSWSALDRRLVRRGRSTLASQRHRSAAAPGSTVPGATGRSVGHRPGWSLGRAAVSPKLRIDAHSCYKNVTVRPQRIRQSDRRSRYLELPMPSEDSRAGRTVPAPTNTDLSPAMIINPTE